MVRRLGIIAALGVVVRPSFLSLLCVASVALGSAGLVGCSGAGGGDAGVVAADDSSTSATTSALNETLPVGATLQTVANLNLRTGPGTDHSVITVIPDGDTVTLVTAAPTRGWYNVQYGSHVGYSSGVYMTASSSTGGGAVGGGGSSGGSGSGGSTGGGTSSSDAVTRAQSWVSAGMPYCGGVNGGSDAICGGTCQRGGAADQSAWNSYRSDCSGLVSYSWGLSAPGLTTAGFAPFDTSESYEIDADTLQPGDALNSDPEEHIILFAGWADQSAGQANIIEEYDCGHDATAHVLTLEFSSGSSTVEIPDWEPHAYRSIRKR